MSRDYLYSNKVLGLADDLWMRMKGESLFITGGSGLYGYWFLSGLLDANRRLGAGITATILTRSPSLFQQASPELFVDGGISLLQGDVVDFVFPATHFSMILHFATTSAQETFSGADSLSKFKTLTHGTERVLQFAAKAGVKKILFTSSGVVYDGCPGGVDKIPETYLGAPETTNLLSALGQGKRAAEFLCAYYADRNGFEFNIARCFSFVGPRLPLDLHYAIGNFIHDALFAEKIIVKGDGMALRSYLYMGDLLLWLLTLLLDGVSGRVYNVGSDQSISIKNLAYLIRDVLSPDKQVRIENVVGQKEGNFVRSCYVPDIARAKCELDLQVWTSLESAIVHAAKYHMCQ